jgi:uncharacterized repeat protein (TIGR03803 family)
MKPQTASLLPGLVAVLVLVAAPEPTALTQTVVTKVADLPPTVGGLQGSLVEGPPGVLYGASASGGETCNCGRIYSVTSGGVVSVVHTFNSADGWYPNAELVVDDAGAIWGTTRYGGAWGGGVIFRIAPERRSAGVHHFDNRAPGREGAVPFGGLVQVGATFHGATSAGGRYAHGTVYSLRQDGTFTVLHHLNGSNGEGRYPRAALVEAGGILFGTTTTEPAIFSVDPATGVYTVRHRFAGWNGSQWPEGRNHQARLLHASNGKLYGASVQGGRADAGTIYMYDPAARTFSSLYHLAPFTAGRHPDGYYVSGGLTEAHGRLWGATSTGGANNAGTLFTLSPDGAFRVVHAFSTARQEGSSPLAPLTATGDGLLYVLTRSAWNTSIHGTLFAVDP